MEYQNWENTKRDFKISFPGENEAIKHDPVEFKVQCLNVFCYHGNESTILFFTQFLEQLLKFLGNLTLLKYVKSRRSYGFLITKELIFGFQILDLKVHFSASLRGSLLANMWLNRVLQIESRTIFCKFNFKLEFSSLF